MIGFSKKLIPASLARATSSSAKLAPNLINAGQIFVARSESHGAERKMRDDKASPSESAYLMFGLTLLNRRFRFAVAFSGQDLALCRVNLRGIPWS